MTQVAESSSDLLMRPAAGVDVGSDDTASDAAFDDFVRSASADLGKLAWVLTLNQDEAAELVQEALARAFARWPKIWATGEDPFPYVRRTIVNLRTDRWRRRLRRDGAEHGWAAQPPVQHADHDPAHAVADRALLASALGDLTDQQRRVVALRYLEDMSIEDASAALGISQGAVKMAASRALKQLRARLEGTGQ